MGFPLIICAAVLSGLLCYKQDLYQTWIFFVNLIFSIYISVFTAPLIADLIPEFYPGVDLCKLPAIMFFLALILIHLLYNATDIFSPKIHENFPLPNLVGKIGGMFFGGLSGAVMLSFLCVSFYMMPFSANIAEGNRDTLVNASRTTLKMTVGAINFFSMQDTTDDEKKILEEVIKAYKAK